MVEYWSILSSSGGKLRKIALLIIVLCLTVFVSAQTTHNHKYKDLVANLPFVMPTAEELQMQLAAIGVQATKRQLDLASLSRDGFEVDILNANPIDGERTREIFGFLIRTHGKSPDGKNWLQYFAPDAKHSTDPRLEFVSVQADRRIYPKGRLSHRPLFRTDLTNEELTMATNGTVNPLMFGFHCRVTLIFQPEVPGAVKTDGQIFYITVPDAKFPQGNTTVTGEITTRFSVLVRLTLDYSALMGDPQL